jgi:hypothetical protein
MADMFQRKSSTFEAPYTADKCIINWGGQLNTANNVTIAYSQQVNRRRTIGNVKAMLWASLPNGQITIQRLMSPDGEQLFGAAGWSACTPGKITLKVAGCKGGSTFKANDCIVTQYQVQLETEGLTVVDNIVIEFLELIRG